MSASGHQADELPRCCNVSYDPNVWTGRASQEAFGDGEVGLALMYPASVWSLMLRAMMDIRALPI
jgi:hypothetical protein